MSAYAEMVQPYEASNSKTTNAATHPMVFFLHEEIRVTTNEIKYKMMI